MKTLLLAVVAALALAVAGNAAASTFYVSPRGADANAGTAAAPWATVARVNTAVLQPGDTVLFEGGATFAGMLQPPASGSSGAPITFSSYGSGRANLSGGISIASRSWLAFDGLRVDTGAWQTAGATRGMTTSSSGTGVTDVVVRNCEFANVTLGMMFSNAQDARWTVTGTTIRSTRDSGILIYDPTAANEIGGGPMTFSDDRILDTGLDATLNYKKHGAYDIGHDITWRNDIFSGFSEGGISLRGRGNTIEGNAFSNGPYAIYHSPYDPTGGVTRIAYNTITNVTQGTITLDASGTVPNAESYVIANNTISAAGSAPGIRVIGTSGSVDVANNDVSTTTGPPLRIDRMPGGGFTESHDLFWSTGAPLALGYLGTTYSSIAAYRSATGKGAGSISADPSAASVLVDAGTASVPRVSYSGDCAGALWHYCGAAPDLGATEAGAAPGPPPPPPPSPLQPAGFVAATAVTGTSLTLTWTPSADPRVVGYRVLRSTTDLGTVATGPFAVGGLTCATQYAFSVVAVDASGAAAAPATATVSTAACPAPVPATPSLALNVTNGQTVPTSFRVTATTSAATGIRNVTFWFDGLAPCVVTTSPYVSCAIKAKQGGHTLRVRSTATSGAYTEVTLHVWCDPSRSTLSARPASPQRFATRISRAAPKHRAKRTAKTTK